MGNEVTAIHLYSEYCKIKSESPTYRLGQHYCNSLGLKDTMWNNLDLFEVTDEKLADKLFYEMCEHYQWDILDLPVKNNIKLPEEINND